MSTLAKKPSRVGKSGLGWQQKYRPSAAHSHYSSPKKVARELPTPHAFYSVEIAQFAPSGSHWAWGCCPFHADKHPSFRMNLLTGGYACQASHCGAYGPSIITFLCQRDGLHPAEARHELEAF